MLVLSSVQAFRNGAGCDNRPENNRSVVISNTEYWIYTGFE